MARNDPQMNLRVPVELKEKIEQAAFENNRTITAEAVSRLEESFNKSNSLISEEKMLEMVKVVSAGYMAAVAKHLKDLNETEANKLLRDLVEEGEKEFKSLNVKK